MRYNILAACLFSVGCGSSSAVNVPQSSTAHAVEQKPLDIPVRQRTPEAMAARAKEIKATADALRQECPGQNWMAWQAATARYREALRVRVEELEESNPQIPTSKFPPAPSRYLKPPLPPLDNFALKEVFAVKRLLYLCDPSTLDDFRSRKEVQTASRWLAQYGIDLILVPVPTGTEVYAKHFVASCPADGIIAPHLRQTLLKMLEDDVEAVDGFRTLYGHGDDLFRAEDMHWAQPGQRVMAKEVARRLQRYQLPTGEGTGDDTNSQLLLIGNSFVPGFREELIHETKCLPRTHWVNDQTTDAFHDFLREPDLLAHCRVVIWVTTWPHMTHFRPLPELP
jgi:hypothetical protein